MSSPTAIFSHSSPYKPLYYAWVTCELPSLQTVPLAGSIFKILTGQRDKITEN